MLLAVAIIWPIVIVCGTLLLLGPPERARQAFVLVRHNAAFMALRFPVALLAAGFAAPLLPAELIATWLGHTSGWTGILIASAIGGFVPSGPVVSFPLALALAKAGVGVPQLVAFLTAWSLLSVHTMMAWELPVLGFRFAVLRFVSSLVLPPLSGFLAALMVGL
jgi:uncharacterized membrane protein YraQ (UPF0718 family)